MVALGVTIIELRYARNNFRKKSNFDILAGMGVPYHMIFISEILDKIILGSLLEKIEFKYIGGDGSTVSF